MDTQYFHRVLNAIELMANHGNTRLKKHFNPELNPAFAYARSESGIKPALDLLRQNLVGTKINSELTFDIKVKDGTIEVLVGVGLVNALDVETGGMISARFLYWTHEPIIALDTFTLSVVPAQGDFMEKFKNVRVAMTYDEPSFYQHGRGRSAREYRFNTEHLTKTDQHITGHVLKALRESKGFDLHSDQVLTRLHAITQMP